MPIIDEEKLKARIIDNFKNYFNFEYKGQEIRLIKPRGERLDILGEDNQNIYIVELKSRRILCAHVDQIKKYMKIYKEVFNPSKPIKGILVAPECNWRAYDAILQEPDITLKILNDYVSPKSINKQFCSSVYYGDATLKNLKMPVKNKRTT